ncbi:sensor domain-containing diguanylate cyclase [Thermodesulfobacteriota bacterium]
MDAKKELRLIEDILEKINTTLTAEELLSYALTKLSNYYEYTSCGIITYDKMTSELKMKISKGLSHTFVKKFHAGGTKDIVEEVFKKSDSLLITEDHPHFNREEYKFEHEYETLYITPLKVGGEIIGAIYFDSVKEGGFANEDLSFFRDFANICSLILAHSNLSDYITRTTDHDSLTGLYSYKYFHEELNREMHRAARAKYPITLFLASIGHLSDFNSVYGHIAGDQAIINIANIIKGIIRENDIPARYGNKFVIIFPDADGEQVAHVAKRICEAMENEKFKEKDPKPILRIGISSYPKDGEEEKELVAHAEKNLYESKRKGGNVYTL